MRVKSAYRQKSREIPATPEIKVDGQQPESAVAMTIDDADGDPAVSGAIRATDDADASKYALLQQIEQLRQSEELQRQHQAALQQHQQAAATMAAMSHKDRIALWRQQGITESEAKFLEHHPEHVDHPQLSALAAQEAMQQGHARDSEAYFRAAEVNFKRYMAHMKQQTPEFFAPAPAPEPSAPSPASYTSAPVSREVPTGGLREPNPNSVRLSRDELAVAQASGISPAEYARHKIRMEREKRTGQRQ